MMHDESRKDSAKGFYARDPAVVAGRFFGNVLYRVSEKKVMAGVIVETKDTTGGLTRLPEPARVVEK